MTPQALLTWEMEAHWARGLKALKDDLDKTAVAAQAIADKLSEIDDTRGDGEYEALLVEMIDDGESGLFAVTCSEGQMLRNPGVLLTLYLIKATPEVLYELAFSHARQLAEWGVLDAIQEQLATLENEEFQDLYDSENRG